MAQGVEAITLLVQLEAALAEEKRVHAHEVEQLKRQLEELHREMASERALLQRI